MSFLSVLVSKDVILKSRIFSQCVISSFCRVNSRNLIACQRTLSSYQPYHPDKPDNLLKKRIPGSPQVTAVRPLFGWLNAIFNRYDPERVKVVGADRACAEWLLRCGASVRWKNSQKFLKDYNSLPVGTSRDLKIIEVDATDSAVMEAGFPYFSNLTELTRIKFKNCKYLTDDSMGFLEMSVGEKLEVLEISFNGSFSDSGIKRLANFKHLRALHLEDLQGIDKPEEVLSFLRENLPDCKITFPPFTKPEVE